MKKGANALLAFALALGAACKGDHESDRREPPPPVASAKPDACAGGGAQLKDAESAKTFPRSFEGFCLDPNNSEKAYGDDTKEPLEKICDLFDGECEIYKGYGVRRVVELRYVDGSGKSATIDIHFSRFAT